MNLIWGQVGRRAAVLASVCTAVLAVASTAPSPAEATLTRGFADTVWLHGPGWVPRTVASGAKRVTIDINWASVEPKAPKRGSHPSSPNDPAYQFKYIDAVVREFEGTGIQPIFLVSNAPRWAEANGGTATQEASGGYKPDAKAYGQLAQALATRYSGHFTDPIRGKHKRKRLLPRVRYFEAWAEANLGVHLSPQWTVEHHAYVNMGARIYRGLLNSFYAGIKRGDRTATVSTTGLAPYGDRPGGPRTPPVQFLRNVLCLSNTGKRQSCSGSAAHFDVIASDPYEVGSPTTLAAVANDASAPDLGKLTALVSQGLAAGTVQPHAPKPLWVTEFSYESRPPNREAVSTATQARWLEESFYVFWREHVTTTVWYLIRDQAGKLSTHYFSGVYFHDGKPKPSLVAYRFPLVVMRNPLVLGALKPAKTTPAPGKTATIWGIAPATGSVRVQFRTGAHWKTLFTTRVRAGNVFVRDIAATQRGDYRAVEDGKSSLVWKY